VPNHIANRITFAAEKADEVFAAVIRDGDFDFETLVPSPPNMYHGDLSASDESDFQVNWNNWSRENWGTKWNAYQGKHGIENGEAFIYFQTAWAPPWPVMAAFCNRFKIAFVHRYFDEGENFWGIDTWGPSKWADNRIQRVEKRYKREEDRRTLALLYWDEETLAAIEKERAEDAAHG
jgi:hypothetical protein